MVGDVNIFHSRFAVVGFSVSSIKVNSIFVTSNVIRTQTIYMEIGNIVYVKHSARQGHEIDVK